MNRSAFLFCLSELSQKKKFSKKGTKASITHFEVIGFALQLGGIFHKAVLVEWFPALGAGTHATGDVALLVALVVLHSDRFVKIQAVSQGLLEKKRSSFWIAAFFLCRPAVISEPSVLSTTLNNFHQPCELETSSNCQQEPPTVLSNMYASTSCRVQFLVTTPLRINVVGSATWESNGNCSCFLLVGQGRTVLKLLPELRPADRRWPCRSGKARAAPKRDPLHEAGSPQDPDPEISDTCPAKQTHGWIDIHAFTAAFARGTRKSISYCFETCRTEVDRDLEVCSSWSDFVAKLSFLCARREGYSVQTCLHQIPPVHELSSLPQPTISCQEILHFDHHSGVKRRQTFIFQVGSSTDW